MVTRISTNQIYLRSQNGIQRSFTELFRAQAQLTGGSRITKPSDDPAGTRRVLALNSERESIRRYQANLDSVEASVNATTGTLTEISATLTQVRQLAVQAANGLNDRTALANIASEVDQLYRTILSAANSRAEGRYLFAGSAVDRQPFEEVIGSDGVARVLYRGNADDQPIDIGPALSATLNTPGTELLGGGARGTTRFTGTTGARVGSGTASGQGRDVLQVRHTGSFFGASPAADGRDAVTGLARGLGSVGTDSILGSGSSLVLTTDALGAGSVSLNGGIAVSFTGTETALRVTDASGRELILDVSNLTANLAGVSVAVRGEGTLSLDGGTTTTAIDFANGDQLVRDSLSGAVLFVDATQIARTGDEEIVHEGTFDLFSTLIGLRDVLRDPTRTTGQIGDEVRARLEDLDDVVDTVTTTLGRVGGRLAQVDLVRERVGALDVTLAELRSDVLDPDIAATISDVARYQTIYETSLLLASRIRQTSLANFLA